MNPEDITTFITLTDEADKLILQIEEAFQDNRELAEVQDLENELNSRLERLETLMWGHRRWQGLPTSVLSELVLKAGEVQATKLDIWFKIHEHIVELFEVEDEWLLTLLADGQDPYEYFQILHRVGTTVLKYSLWRELEHRIQENEDPNGKRVREFLVHQNQETLDPVIDLVLWCTPQFEGDLCGKEEKQSIAREKLCEEFAEYLPMKPVALDHKGLQALVEGRFNKALWHVRDRVRASLRTEATFQNRKINDDPEVLLRAIQPGRSDIAAVESKILLEKLSQHLTPRQRQFIEIRYQVDTDKEAAEKMGVTPQAVAQLKSGLRETVREMLGNS